MRAGSHGTALSPQPGTTVPPARLHTGSKGTITDGIVETRNPTGEFFGADRLAELVSANRSSPSQDLIERIVLEARGFAGETDFEDDVTLVLLRRGA